MKCTCPKDVVVLPAGFAPANRNNPLCPQHSSLPEVPVDFNTPPLEWRGDARDEYTAAWVGGLSLRQQVILVDDDIRVLGRVSGLRDLGYGRFLIVEVSE